MHADDANDEADAPRVTTFNGTLERFRHAPSAEAVSNVRTRSQSVALLHRAPWHSPPPSKRAVEGSRKRSAAAANNNDEEEEQSPRRTTKKKRRTPSRYADPTTYAHLPPLPDILAPHLICVFVGTNPGIRTAEAGHAYAHPSNQFWKLLYKSGLTDRLCRPEEDGELPRLYAMGNTNIVARPSRDAAELSKAEMAAGTVGLEEKVRRYKPEAVCIVGKGIWEAIWRWRYGRNLRPAEFLYGWQDERENMGRSEEGREETEEDGGVWQGARVYVTTSTSGLAASLRPAEKEAIWKPFGEWVRRRRMERGMALPPPSPPSAHDSGQQ